MMADYKTLRNSVATFLVTLELPLNPNPGLTSVQQHTLLLPLPSPTPSPHTPT